MKSAMSHFIKCSSLASLQFSYEQLLFMQEILILNATHTNIEIGVVAADALKYMHTSYFDDPTQIDTYSDVLIEM